jgi:ketosteroid isomerase-like protein
LNISYRHPEIAEGGDVVTAEDRLGLLQRFSTAWRAKDVDALMELMTDDCEFRASIGPEPGASFVGSAEVRRGYALFVGAVDAPAAEISGYKMLVDGDFAVIRMTRRSPRTEGSPFDVHICDVYEFDGDRIKLKDAYRKVLDAPSADPAPSPS